MSIRKIFRDLLSSRNKIHWDDRDIEYFLSTKGKIISVYFKQVQPEETDKLAAMITSGNLRNIKRIIICVYAGIEINIDDFSKIIECVITSIPINQDKTGILIGWIEDGRKHTSGISVRLVAICSNSFL
jgi:hypothetical protein